MSNNCGKIRKIPGRPQTGFREEGDNNMHGWTRGSVLDSVVRRLALRVAYETNQVPLTLYSLGAPVLNCLIINEPRNAAAATPR